MPASTRPKVLLVEDEVTISTLLQEALAEAGFDVATAFNYHEAIAALDAHEGHLAGLITDVRIGAGGSGWDVARHARESAPTLPVVYTSGNSAHEWFVEGVPESVMVAKPFAPAQIVVALASLANRTDASD
ncbi:MAG: response regulator [Caulobacteraceae bacterium]